MSSDLWDWWVKTVSDDFQGAVPKAEEYGAHDLEMIGWVLGFLPAERLDDTVAAEMGCWFYVLGKVMRLFADYKANRPGKADTWHDIVVYAMMARRIQYAGGWPGEAQNAKE